MLLLLRLNSHPDSSGAKYVFLQYIKCTLKPDGMEKKLCYVCLRWRNTGVKDLSAVEEGLK